MHFQTLLTLLAAAASTTLAAPTGSAAPVEAVSNELSARGATPPPWTIENFKRTCGGGTCHYTYSIYDNLPVDGVSLHQLCDYKVKGTPATHASYDGIKCGAYTVSSAWNSQGFTTMSIHKDDRIVYPSYSDVELKGGKVVSPNKKFEVSSTSAAKREVSARGAHVTQWSLQDFSRTCGGGVCHYSYGIYDGSGNAATPCGYNVMGTPATHASYDSVKCGKFIVTSAWDNQFGDENGFSTMSVNDGEQIGYPSYSDAELKGGAVISERYFDLSSL